MTDQEKIEELELENKRLGLAYESLKIAFSTLAYNAGLGEREIYDIMSSIRTLANRAHPYSKEEK